jgi:hypothetical protein
VYVITTNHEIVIDGTDHAIWRRMLLHCVNNKFLPPYEYKIKKKNKTLAPNEKMADPGLRERISTPEFRSALLSVLLHNRDKLITKFHGNIHEAVSKRIRMETAEYRHRQDKFTRFVESNIAFNPRHTERLDFTLIIKRFINWRRQQGEHHNLSQDEIRDNLCETKLKGCIVESETGNKYIPKYVELIMDDKTMEDDCVLFKHMTEKILRKIGADYAPDEILELVSEARKKYGNKGIIEMDILGTADRKVEIFQGNKKGGAFNHGNMDIDLDKCDDDDLPRLRRVVKVYNPNVGMEDDEYDDGYYTEETDSDDGYTTEGTVNTETTVGDDSMTETTLDGNTTDNTATDNVSDTMSDNTILTQSFPKKRAYTKTDSEDTGSVCDVYD